MNHALLVKAQVLRLHRYLSVNYEYSNFSISQCVFEDGASANILPFLSADLKSKPASNHKVIIGTTVGATVFLLLSLVAFFIFKSTGRRRKRENKIASSPSSKSLSPSFSQISSTPKEIGENSLSGFHNGHREMEDTSPAQLIRQGRLGLLSQTSVHTRQLPKLSSLPASSRSKPQSPVSSHLEREIDPGQSFRQSLRWNPNRHTFERTIPPPGRASYRSRVSLLGRPLPLTLKEDASSFQTDSSKERQVRQNGRRAREDIHEWMTGFTAKPV